MEREQQFMETIDVGEEVLRVDVQQDTCTWTGRWCHRQKGGGVRNRYVSMQQAWNEDVFSGMPDWVCVRVFLTIAHLHNLAAVIGASSAAPMHTTLGEKERIYVEPPRDWVMDKSVARKLTEQLSTSQLSFLFQNFIFGIFTEKLGFEKVASASIVSSMVWSSVSTPPDCGVIGSTQTLRGRAHFGRSDGRAPLVVLS